MPLIYNALESEHTVVSFCRNVKNRRDDRILRRQVQEQALKVVPDLCETIDYAEVQGVLFPRVAVSTLFLGTVKSLLTLSTPVTPARFHENEGFERESGHAFDLLDHGENPRSDGSHAEACPIALQDPDERAGSDGMTDRSLARSCRRLLIGLRWPPYWCKRRWGSRLTERRSLWPSYLSCGKWPWVLVCCIHS